MPTCEDLCSSGTMCHRLFFMYSSGFPLVNKNHIQQVCEDSLGTLIGLHLLLVGVVSLFIGQLGFLEGIDDWQPGGGQQLGHGPLALAHAGEGRVQAGLLAQSRHCPLLAGVHETCLRGTVLRLRIKTHTYT